MNKEWKAAMLDKQNKRPYVINPMGHTWESGNDGIIEIFAFTRGEYCNGPRCTKCGYGFCHHCIDWSNEGTECKREANDMKHTPIHLPLNIKEVDNPSGNIFFVRDAEERIITHTREKSRAQYLVTACNLHEELIEALKVAKGYVEFVEQAPDSDLEDTVALDLCHAALAKAGR